MDFNTEIFRLLFYLTVFILASQVGRRLAPFILNSVISVGLVGLKIVGITNALLFELMTILFSLTYCWIAYWIYTNYLQDNKN